MQCDNRNLTMVSMAMAFVLALGCVSVMESSDAETIDYDKDLGQFWSYTVQFIFDGSSAQTISWDFGDGSEPSTEFNPRHEFPSTGVYMVTQTTVNTVGETVEHYRVEIMGFPHVTLVYCNGSENGIIQQTAYNVAAEKPADPSRDGYDSTGWFTDEGCTQAYDWDTTVKSPVTLYAGWEKVGSETPGDEDQNVEGDNLYLYASIICACIAALMVLAAVLLGSVFMAVPAVFVGIVSIILGLISGGLI